jgi:hypothetical protein
MYELTTCATAAMPTTRSSGYVAGAATDKDLFQTLIFDIRAILRRSSTMLIVSLRLPSNRM